MRDGEQSPGATMTTNEKFSIARQLARLGVDIIEAGFPASSEANFEAVQQGREPTDVDFCSIAIDGGLENDILQQRLHTVLKQREQLQHMEIGLRAQEQLHKRGQQIHELERKIEENERELNAIRLDNEDAWAKEDLLREQSKELQSYRYGFMFLVGI
ncbi:uncharacterized protein Fot_36931 [Forsythia ovata]|uniref:Pyruvate carboxyltransferase domain-containing protein n=1 Tax=Forsythia ovata TaxID=205694 RepID=A0ABD1SRW5_9LAMI